MSKIKKLLDFMESGKWYRERDFISKEKTDEEKYMFYLCGHSALSSLLFYGVKRGYIERRKRTKRNFEYKKC